MNDQALNVAVATYAARGWRVESWGPGWTTMVHGRRANHLLHLFLTVFTLGLWLPVWLIVGLTAKEQRKMLRLCTDGVVRDENGRTALGMQPAAA